MGDSSSDPTAANEKSISQKAVCTVCYEDLNPVTELLQCIPACGHVFHELCLQQWLEYCAGGKKPTCPVCKQPCGTHHKPTRLYFQSTGSSSDGGTQLATSAADSENLSEEVTKLSCKVKNLTAAIEAQKNISNNLREEVEVSKKLAQSEKANSEQMKRERLYLEQLLNIKTEEISKKKLECAKLQEKSLSLAKELAALKLATDLNLEEDDITKFASLGNSKNPQNALDVLKKSLALRNKGYKELMSQCNILGRSETKMEQKLEKAKEQIKTLKARLLELEKDNEERENGILRGLKNTNKKMKFESEYENPVKNNNINVNTIETIDLENDTQFMNFEEFLGSKGKLSNNCTNISNNKIEKEMEDFENWTPPVYVKTGEDKSSKDKGLNIIDNVDFELNPVFQSDLIGVQNSNYCTDKPGLQNGIMGNGGIKKSIGKWCKNDSLNNINKANGDLISIGADGKGGRIKILRPFNQFQDVKRNVPKKVGVKGGQSQLEQFFGKR